ncbi:PUR1-like protein [Mya arenaria]|uniref:Amidophosphoribosyltransferase n=1 Tax=Mya arenaria TaxID=6604 RepID=A0ABY7DND3_MYAAR|nr:PUR1-like protein [Mya arenaria]
MAESAPAEHSGSSNMTHIAPLEDSGMRDACGVFGCVAANSWPTQLDIPQIISLGLVGLQHRGQESGGMVTSMGTEGARYKQKKASGYINAIFSDDDMIKLKGNLGIVISFPKGHTRYSTVGGSDVTNIQPFVVETLHGLIAVAHNGELVNSASLKHKLLKHGVGLSTGSDTELIIQLLTHMPDCGEPNGANWVGRIRKMMKQTPTSYSLVIMHNDKIYAVRDPYGNRPLCIGKLLTAASFSGGSMLQNGEDSCDGYVVSSESCSFGAIGAKLYREVLPGEIVELSKDGIKSQSIVARPEAKLPAFCIFEYVYFARPDSIFEGQMVYEVRRRCGRQLALESPAQVDLVSTVPESATPAAIAYADALGIPYGEVLCKNRYVGRTFIQPSMRLRKLGVAKKFGLLTGNFQNKRVVLVDDSIVRGNTMKPVIQMLKNAGAKEVHVRVASPLSNTRAIWEELVANRVKMDKIANHFGADSLKYLSVEGLVKATQEGITRTDNQPVGHCVACLTGTYPVKLDW